MSDVLELVIPHKLATPNRSRGFHWRKKHRDTKIWETLLQYIGGGKLNGWSVMEKVEWLPDGRGHLQPHEVKRKERRRVIVIREVKYAHHFIQDDDNLRFAVKPLNDALTRLGLIYDDKREWLDQPMPEQRVSADRQVRTIIRIERITEASHAA